MHLATLVSTSSAVAATRSRLAKRDALSALLREADPEDVEILVAYLAGELRQRRTGVGWQTLRTLPPPADQPRLTVVEVDAELQRISELSGAGSSGARTEAVALLFGRATADEQDFLRRLMSGAIRQGALDSAMLDAVASASDVPLADVRRAVMLRGATGPVALAALTEGGDAVRAFSLEVGQPVRPMLASTAPDVGAAMEKCGGDGAEVCIDTKLDGIRVQVHKAGDEVGIYTRSLDDVTARFPRMVEVVRELPVGQAILDGEAIALDDDGRPLPFQDTASMTARQDGEGETVESRIRPFFFDCLHVDGDDLIDLPLSERLLRLDAIIPAEHTVDRLVSSEVDAISDFFVAKVEAGQEGVVLKSLSAPYDAGRRGAAWVKVKPRHTLDLVVLAIEWGSGRRQGWLSNIHLGARDPDGGGFVMLGKTFKGMTDEILAWQTERFTELAVDPSTISDDYVVEVRPEQVVEIAFDGLQRSRRYPGGLALRFARVLRYRDDKTAAEADTIATVRSLA